MHMPKVHKCYKCWSPSTFTVHGQIYSNVLQDVAAGMSPASMYIGMYVFVHVHEYW